MIVDELYSDLNPSITKSWNNDVAVDKGYRSVRNSIIGLIQTRKGTRVFNPLVGCDISDEIFENLTPLSSHMVKQSIYDCIRNFEPRVSHLTVEAFAEYDNNALNVSITYSIVDSPDVVDQIKLNLSA